MAIYHLSAQIISRGGGRSAVAAAAYRHATQMYAERTGQSFSYASKHDVAHTEIMLPDETPEWLRNAIDGRDTNGASEAIWNAVELFEKRADAQLAREVEVALPVEFTAEENLDTVREFAKRFTDNGQIVDFAFHNKAGNPHVHIMLTMRPLTVDGFGKKKVPVLDERGEIVREGQGDKRRIKYRNFAGQKDTLLLEREAWAGIINRRLIEKGIDQQIDHRSFKDRGIELEPTQHRGLFADAVKDKGIVRDSLTREQKISAENVALLTERPELIWEAITDKKSVFDADDIAKALTTRVQDREAFLILHPKLVNSDELVRLSEEVKEGGQTVKAKYTTRSMIELERGMADRALGMKSSHSHQVRLSRVQAAIRKAALGESYQLSEQQAGAVHSITGPQQLASIVGLAGAGKSTLLKAANLAWKAQGYNPIGLSLAGKAVDELEKSSGIEGRTIASLEYRLKHGMQTITEKDVLVVDEAGMVGSKQLDKLLRAAQAAGAKVVLVGDYDQLPAINAGAAFRAIAYRTGYYEVSEIHRQSAGWMKQASLDFARGNIKEALGAYQDALAIGGFSRQDEAFDALAADFATKHKSGEMTLALAHSNKTVQELNDRIRANLKQSGDIGQGFKFETAKSIEDRREDRAANQGQTPSGADYRYDFGKDDRIVFLQNDKIDGVKVRNGQLGRVIEAKEGHMTVELENGERVAFGQERYNHISHGFAVTIYKSQGVTVDNTLVLAQRSMTQNLAYVAMTRHKKSAQMYYGEASFPRKLFKGGIVEALSRPAAKSTTLDYEGTIDYQAAVGFGQRRGFNPSNTILDQMKAFTRRQALKLASLTERLLKAAPSISRTAESAQQTPEAARKGPWDRAEPEWLVAPETSFGTAAEEMAQIRALKSEAFLQAEERCRAELGEAFKDVDKIMAKYMPSITDASIGKHAFSDGLSDEFENYGELHGRKGLTASRADRAKRSAAVKASRGTRSALRDMKGAYQWAYGKAITGIRRGRESAKVGIPVLSEAADKTLKELYSLEGKSFHKLKKESAAEIAEIEAFTKAVQKRFGEYHVIFGDGQKGLTKEQAIHMPILSQHENQIKLAQAVADKVEFTPERSLTRKNDLKL